MERSEEEELWKMEKKSYGNDEWWLDAFIVKFLFFFILTKAKLLHGKKLSKLSALKIQNEEKKSIKIS